MKEKDNFSILTQKDVLILKKLLEDGRKSSSSISKEIDLGREIVNYRIKRLIKENLIVKFIPKVNEEALNYKEYIILLKLNLNDEISRERFVKEQIGNKYLVWIVKSASGWDLVIRLYAQSIAEFKDKLNEILESYSSVLAKYYTIIATDEIKASEKELISKQVFNEDFTKNNFKVVKKQDPVELDEKNKEIFSLFKTNTNFIFQSEFFNDNDKICYKQYLQNNIFEAKYIIVCKNIDNSQVIYNTIILIITMTCLIFLSSFFIIKQSTEPYKKLNHFLDDFLKDAMHELKTPIGVARINVDLLQMKIKKDTI